MLMTVVPPVDHAPRRGLDMQVDYDIHQETLEGLHPLPTEAGPDNDHHIPFTH